jgi:uncharacterized protein YukE
MGAYMGSLQIKIPDNFKTFAKQMQKLKQKYRGIGAEIGVIKNATGEHRRKVSKISKKTGKKLKSKVAVKTPKTITIAEEAFYNCKGVPELGIPARDYQTKTVNDNQEKWKKDMKTLLKKGANTRTAITAIAKVARDDTKNTIETFATPPNAPSTIAAKGFNKPLVHEGDLQKAQSYQILGEERV